MAGQAYYGEITAGSDSSSALLRSLRAKYGKETNNMDTDCSSLYDQWFWQLKYTQIAMKNSWQLGFCELNISSEKGIEDAMNYNRDHKPAASTGGF